MNKIAAEVAKKIEKNVKKTKAFENGTVITWDSVSAYNGVSYNYAAVFANGMWYTTVAADNRYVQKKMTNESLMKYFGEMEGVENIKVASEFVEVEV